MFSAFFLCPSLCFLSLIVYAYLDPSFPTILDIARLSYRLRVSFLPSLSDSFKARPINVICHWGRLFQSYSSFPTIVTNSCRGTCALSFCGFRPITTHSLSSGFLSLNLAYPWDMQNSYLVSKAVYFSKVPSHGNSLPYESCSLSNQNIEVK